MIKFRLTTILAICLVSPLLSSGLFSAPRVLLDEDFSSSLKKISPAKTADHKPPAGTIDGVLPKGWKEDSSWAKITVHYLPMTEEGKSFLRVDVPAFESGACQFAGLLPKLDAGKYYRAILTARSKPRTPLQTGVRFKNSPWTFLFSANPALGGTWKEYTYLFKVEDTKEPVGFWFIANPESHKAQIDLAHLKLEELTREDLQAEFQSAIKGTGAKNLVRISRFPQGLQSGWFLGRDYSGADDVETGPDNGLKGPSNAPSLRIQSKAFFKLMSAPFGVINRFDSHVLSFYLRGSGSGKVMLLADGKSIAEKQFQAGPKWERFSMAFTPDLVAQAHGMQFEGAGEFFVDALQVEQGSQATEYASAADCEVSLACDSAARIQFEDEPAVVRWCVSGKAEGGVLKAKVVNLYGESADLPGQELGNGFIQDGKLEFGALKSRPFGPFRVEAWVEDKQGRKISTDNELVVYRLHRPRYWGKDAPDSAFGTHCTAASQQIQAAKSLGANWVRLHDAGSEYIGWHFLEPKPGQWSFRDKEINRYRDAHLKIMGALSTSPLWANYCTVPHNDYFDKFYEPKNLKDFANYVTVVTKRYKGVIDTWDVWNEPWGGGFWCMTNAYAAGDPAGNEEKAYKHGPNAEADYAELQKAAYQAAKAVDPSLTLMGLNTTWGEVGTRWTEGVISNGALDPCDVLSYHTYISGVAGFPGDDVELGIRQCLGLPLQQLGNKPKPIWMTEGSPIGGHLGSPFYHYTLPYEDTEDWLDTSARLTRFVVSLLSRGVKRCFIYSMHCYESYRPASADWRVLVSQDGFIHPCGAAYSAMAWQLEDTQFARSVPVADGVNAYLFEGKGRSVAVIMGKAGHAGKYVPPPKPEIEVTDLYGNPLGREGNLEADVCFVAAKAGVKALEEILK